jgi:alpha-tubulin suppressor-like RCC1 family protein
LFHNELQSQYINLLIAGGLLVVHVTILVFRKIYADYLATHVTAGMILEAFPLLWLSVPLLVGSVSIAEERKLGTLENLLCLPTTRRFQFILKLGVTIGLGVLLGVVVPVTLEGLARLLGVATNPSGLWVINASRSTTFLLLFGSIGLSFFSFYASTLTRNTLQALGAGVLVSVLGFVSIAVAVEPPNLGDVILWRGILVGLIGTPVMLLTLLGLAYGNYKRLQVDIRMWNRNAILLALALLSVAGITTTVYHRTWEAWLQLEPTHHFFSSYYANRGRHFPANPKLQATSSRAALLLPDGRLWLRHRRAKMEQVQVRAGIVEIPQAGGFWRSGLLPGSSWSAVALSDTSCFALQADGSLWDISPDPQDAAAIIVPKRVGTDHDWKLISGGAEHFTALKTDGSLWEWGRISAALGKSVDPEKLVTPTRVGTEDDWVAVGDCEDRRYNPAIGTSVAVKSDGSIWRWGRLYSGDKDGSPKWQVAARPEKWLRGPAQLPVSVNVWGNAIAIVYEDGTLWLGGYRHLFLGSEKEELAAHQMVPWEEDANWKEVKMYSWDNAVGIKKDGSLWQFQSLSPPWQKEKWLLSRTRPSQYSDWLAVCADRDAFLAFAGDGSVSLWGDPWNAAFWFNEPDPQRLLLPSRIKARRLATIPW